MNDPETDGGDASTGGGDEPAGGASGGGGSQAGAGAMTAPAPAPIRRGTDRPPTAAATGTSAPRTTPTTSSARPASATPATSTRGTRFPYTVDFENLPTADLPAQVVVVTESLDSSLDWSTFQLGDFGFGPYQVHVPAGTTSYSARIDARDTRGLFVDVTAKFDAATGVATWTFTSIDPTTGDQTGDTLAGFLPPTPPRMTARGSSPTPSGPRPA